MPLGRSVRHHAQTDAGDFQAGRTKSDVFHRRQKSTTVCRLSAFRASELASATVYHEDTKARRTRTIRRAACEAGRHMGECGLTIISSGDLETLMIAGRTHPGASLRDARRIVPAHENFVRPSWLRDFVVNKRWNQLTTSTSLPMCALESITRCASAADRSGNVAWITGVIAPDSKSGQTCWRSAAAIAPFSAIVRARSVDPVSVTRRCIIAIRFSCAL